MRMCLEGPGGFLSIQPRCHPVSGFAMCDSDEVAWLGLFGSSVKNEAISCGGRGAVLGSRDCWAREGFPLLLHVSSWP